MKENKRWSLAVLFAVFLLLNALSPCVAQSRVNSKPQQATRFNWTGKYVAETYEGSTYGGTGICYEIEITLVRVNNEKYKDDYFGTLCIDGYQTSVNAGVTAHADGRRVTVYFDDDRDSYPELGYKEGDVVAVITYTTDKRLHVQWFGDVRGYVNKNTTFKMKKLI